MAAPPHEAEIVALETAVMRGFVGAFCAPTLAKEQAAHALAKAAGHSEREAHEALKHAQGRMLQAEKLRGLGMVVAGVAHEINNPLAIAINNLAVLQRDCKLLAGIVNRYQQRDEYAVVTDATEEADSRWQQANVELREEAERIDLPYTLESLEGLIVRSRDGLARIQQIVSDLRGFSREEAAEEIEENANLNSGIDTAMSLVKARAAKKRITLEAELAPLPGVTCQTAKVNQVIFNLLLNAIDASHEGGIVTVRSRPTADGVEVQVVDRGVGIQPEILTKIFDPFFTTKPPGHGTGLGLSVSYAIVAEHGGKIVVDSQVGRGSCFTVCLPLSPPGTGTTPR